MNWSVRTRWRTGMLWIRCADTWWRKTWWQESLTLARKSSATSTWTCSNPCPRSKPLWKLSLRHCMTEKLKWQPKGRWSMRPAAMKAGATWRVLLSHRMVKWICMNIGTKLFLKWDRSVVSRITVYGMHRKVLPWSFALKMMIEHVYGEWAGVHCNEDQGRSWILDIAFFRLTDGTTTLICRIPNRLKDCIPAENLDLQFASVHDVAVMKD